MISTAPQREDRLQLIPPASEINSLLPDGFPLDFLRRARIIPLSEKDGILDVALVSLEFLPQAQALAGEMGLTAEPVLASGEEIDNRLSALYDMRSTSTQDAANAVNGTKDELDIEGIREEILTDQVDAPVIRLVNSMILQSLKERASDIHVEPEEEELVVRYRIDGVLHQRLRLPKTHQAPLITRIKVMARMDIAERFSPQDGRIGVKIGGKELDIRVGLIPTKHGERLAMRLLDKEKGLIGLEEMGMATEELSTMRNMIAQPNGIILFTGPTGSGKTTSLYAILQELAKPTVNVVTIEDPIEYALPGVGQIQVNEKAGVTFASGLRAILRQDPDIVMVGEMRDAETASIGVQAALTGHLVLSTLHTNDAPSTIARLVDMGIEPYLISSSLIGVVAQRLVRRICPHCRKEIAPDSILREHGVTQAYIGAGCGKCMGTGFLGRVGIYEQFLLDDELREIIAKDPSASSIKRTARNKGMRNLFELGLLKVMKGVTTSEEVFRVTGGGD